MTFFFFFLSLLSDPESLVVYRTSAGSQYRHEQIHRKWFSRHKSIQKMLYHRLDIMLSYSSEVSVECFISVR